MATEFGGKYRVRERGLFSPTSSEPHRISRSKIELYTECPRCFYIDQRLGVGRPETPSFTLNNAVDELFKREFDTHRANATPHPLMKAYGLKAVPLKHKDLDLWRDALRNGVSCLHKETNLFVRGGIDDVWVNEAGELIVVDYKATSKRKEIELYEAYKRQAEVYQWLFTQNGFKVSKTAYFVYANGRSDAEAFDGKLEFEVQLIPHQGDYSWVEPTLREVKKCLMSETAPERGVRCDYCPYREAAGKALMRATPKKESKSIIKRQPKKKDESDETTGQLF